MYHNELTFLLLQLMETKRATTFFINGSPGSGKSVLLTQLAIVLPQINKRIRIFGPYETNSFQSLTLNLTKDMFDSIYLNTEIPEDISCDLLSTFDWLKNNIHATANEKIVILVDLDYKNMDIDSIRSWFSSIRSLEDRWEDGPNKILIILTSYWNHNILDNHYREIRLSFPYTLSHNYFLWRGISPQQMDEIVQQQLTINGSVVPYGSLIHELTDGHPGAALEIIEQMKTKQEYSISTMIDAVKLVAKNGKTAKNFVNLWKDLSQKNLSIICHLLRGYLIPANKLRPYIDGLTSANLVSEVSLGNNNFSYLSSWYIECVLRYHLEDIGVEDAQLKRVDVDDLIPPLSSIHKEAYIIINEIENLIRNFTTIRLSEKLVSEKTLLADKVIKYNNNLQKNTDAQERALSWKNKSKKAGLSVDMNPEIAYLSIQDLASLVGELAREIKSDEWKNISKALQTTTDIRDAVMHNQLIDDSAFNQLFSLRSSIYEALKPVQI